MRKYSFTESKSPSTPAQTTTTPSNPTFYRDTFTRPTSISLDLFKGSSTAMEEGITRNPFPHWKRIRWKFWQRAPKCKCEVSRHKFAFCADCKQKSIPLAQIAREEEWSKKIHEEDAYHQDQHMI